MSAFHQPAVFFDKDGTLVENVPYNVDYAEIRLMPGAAAAARRLATAGYAVVVVTNQSGIAQGLFDETALVAVEARLRELLQAEGAVLDGFYYCPHLPNGRVLRYAVPCDCRKPAPGLLCRAARELNLDLRRSWIVGDILDDVEAGHQAGCCAILLNVGGETQWRFSRLRRPEAVVADLAAAATHILSSGTAATKSLLPTAETFWT